MSNKEAIYEFYTKNNINFKKSDSYSKLADRLDELDCIPFNIEELTTYYRNLWEPCNIKKHIDNLKTGLLKGHSWHGAMPSMLHMSMQDRVRECINGKLSLENLIGIGADIMKHEYFMVAAHDLIETSIIQSSENCIPPIRYKSISDFVFKGIPYDLKNTNYPTNWDRKKVNKNKKAMAAKFIKGADITRIRKQAAKTINGWGKNRFFVMVEEMDRWLYNPEELIKEIIEESNTLKDPVEIKLEEMTIQVQLIAI